MFRPKRWLAWLLSAMMLLTVLPAGVLAAEDTVTPPPRKVTIRSFL